MSFHTEARLLSAIASAPTLAEQGRLVEELQALRAARAAHVQSDKDIEWADTVIRETLTPVSTHIFHTAATEWLDDVSETPSEGAHQEMMAEAAAWFQRTSAFVKSDEEEFAEQAIGMARRLSGKYGEGQAAAAQSFLDYASFLHSREAASGLDQIQQTIDANNSPKTTELPQDTFDTFAEPVAPENAGVDEAQSSWNAQTVNEMISGGGGDLSGGGPGLAGGQVSPGGGKPSEHSTGNDLSGHYGPPSVTASREDADVAPFGLTSLAISHVGNLDDFRAAFAAEATAQTAAPQKEAKRECGPCTNGNHSGTNGTQGCRGKWCGCTASGCGKQSNTDTGGKSRESFDAENKKESAKYEVVSRWGKNPAKTAAFGEYDRQPEDDEAGEHCSECGTEGGYGRPGSNCPDCHDNLDKMGLCPTCTPHSERSDWEQHHLGSKTAASGLDQIEQTTAPDGVTEKPTPLPGEVMFDLNPAFQGEESTGAPGAPENPSQEHQSHAVKKEADMFGNSDTEHKVPGSEREGYNQESNASPKTAADPDGPKDVPASVSRDFSNDAHHDFNVKATADYRKAYAYAQKWKPGMVLVTTGSAEFETGIFEGLTDENRAAFLARHVEQAKDYPVLAERIVTHAVMGAHFAKTAGTGTDLMTTSPDTYPDSGGQTPINGPGTTPPLAGGMDAAAPGGPAPYNGANPLGHSVVPGVDQKPDAPHPTNMQPPAENDHGVDTAGMSPRTLSFRKHVQATLLAENTKN